MTEKAEGLKACPFCKCEMTVTALHDGYPDHISYYAKGKHEYMCFLDLENEYQYFNIPEELITAWNRATTRPSHEPEKEEK